MPIDQALEKAYNKPAKDPGGIIGFTRKKESVAKWNLIRHEKSGFTKFIEDFSDRNRSSSTYGIKTAINPLEQPLPAELQKIWVCDDNKISLQQFFIAWICNNYHGDKYVYLGGCHEKVELYECYMLHNGVKSQVRLLHCTHEEADDKMQYHISHAVDIDRISQVLVSSADIDVFCSLMYHFPRWKGKGLELMWVEHNKKLSSINESVEHI